jgi:DNA-binding ferritin-like protein
VIDVLAPRLADAIEVKLQVKQAQPRVRSTFAALSSTLAQFGRAIRASIDLATKLDGTGTAALIRQISREVHKQLRFIEAHLQGAR